MTENEQQVRYNLVIEFIKTGTSIHELDRCVDKALEAIVSRKVGDLAALRRVAEVAHVLLSSEDEAKFEILYNILVDKINSASVVAKPE